jgi:hypothetical protein
MQDIPDLVKSIQALQKSLESLQAHATGDKFAKTVQERVKKALSVP